MASDLLWVFGLGIGLACAVHLWREGRRRRVLTGAAARCSLSYTPRDPLDLPNRYSQLFLFRQGHDRFASHVLSGSTSAGPVRIFSYGYDLGFGSDRRHVRWVVGVLETNRANPAVVLGDGHENKWQGLLPGHERSLGVGPIQMRARQEIPDVTIEALRKWFSRGRRRYHVELQGRFVAIYCRQDDFADDLCHVLDDLKGLGMALEGPDHHPQRN